MAETTTYSPNTALREWWVEKADLDAAKVVPKAMEYGASDLEIMGAAMVEMMPHLENAAMGREAAIAFYVLGKVARIISALRDGRHPNVDSWFDIGVYAQIAQYERTEGPWPGL